MSSGRVLRVCRGRAVPLQAGGREVLSGFRKQPVEAAVSVGPLGLEGDEQADPSVHGGLAKAVYAYPSEHYPFWQTVRAQAGAAAWGEPLPAAALGENLTLEGLLEADAWVGDRLRLPDCVLAVSAPRLPCFKLAAAMGFAAAVKLMAQSRWCGFYLAVHEPGCLAAGQAFTIEPGPREVSVAELFAARAGQFLR